MRAHFVRGGDPKETMDIGTYRSDAPKRNIFLKMHEKASKSDMFEIVTYIREEGKEPSFKIRSKKITKEGDPQEFTIYLTQDEGIILFDDNTDEEYPDISLKEFVNITFADES